MYALDPAVDQRLLQLARRAAGAPNAARLQRVTAAIRNADDGSTELYAVVVVDDDVRRMRRADRNVLLAAVEAAVRAGLRDEHLEYDASAPRVSFLTETEERADERRP